MVRLRGRRPVDTARWTSNRADAWMVVAPRVHHQRHGDTLGCRRDEVVARTRRRCFVDECSRRTRERRTYGAIPMRATGSAGACRRYSARSRECSSTLRISRGSISSSTPNAVARPVRRLDLLAQEHRRFVFVRSPRPAHRGRAHRAHRCAGEREHGRLAVERDHAHDHRAEAVGLAQRHLELRCGRQRLRGVHARALAEDASLLRLAARQHTRVVGQEDEREMERVGDRDEVRGLVGAVGVDRTRERRRLVRDDRDRMPAEAARARR